MTQVTEIWRHPIKSHGREALQSVALEAGKTMPWDRVWAVAHEAARLAPDATEWAPCANFSRGSKAPALMAISAEVNEETGKITLTHPDQGTCVVDPEDAADAADFIAWTRPLCPKDRAQPDRIYKAAGRGLTDSDFPSVSIIGHASCRALADAMGAEVSPLRFRGNIWLDGDLAPFEEFDWVGREFTIGGVTFRGMERIERCLATTANPATGRRDLDTLGALRGTLGHIDMGIRAEVIAGGTVSLGDICTA